MTDLELLRLAAKAARIEVDLYQNDYGEIESSWNPLVDDGDALRLAVALSLYIEIKFDVDMCQCALRLDSVECSEVGQDPYSATRRAIVRAAAESGRDAITKAKGEMK